MTKTKIKISGSIPRNCENCGKSDHCLCFVTEDDNKSHIMCSSCVFKIFEYGKPKRNKDLLGNYEYCNECQGMTMKLDEDSIKITDTQVIKVFVCEKCGKKIVYETKKWGKRK